jgi:hypothetical protein
MVLKRGAPMKRTGFKRKGPPRVERPDRSAEFASYVAPASTAVMARALDDADVVTIEKDEPVRSEPYRRLVASFECIHCGAPGPSQAAHADMGKGMSLKTDDRTCYPLCATKVEGPGCHDTIGASGAFTREQRRELEQRYGAATRERIKRLGLWPVAVPAWA